MQEVRSNLQKWIRKDRKQVQEDFKIIICTLIFAILLKDSDFNLSVCMFTQAGVTHTVLLIKRAKYKNVLCLYRMYPKQCI